MKKNPKKSVKISIILTIVAGIILAICKKIENVGVVEKYGLIINEGRTSFLEIILLSGVMILFIAMYVIELKMSRCPKCNKYISANIHTEYCPYCSEKLPEIDEK